MQEGGFVVQYLQLWCYFCHLLIVQSGATPLLTAVHYEHLKILEYLLNNGADINAVNSVSANSTH